MSSFLEVAKDAALSASEVLLENLGSISTEDIEKKQASDYVTYVDRESEKRIVEVIKKAFPEHLLLTEESIKQSSTAQYRWIIDPLDGTTNYIHSYPVFSVSIALQYREEIVVAVVYDPIRKEMFTAEKGGGAFLNGKRLDISKRKVNPDTALIATGFPFRAKHLTDEYFELFKAIFARCSDLRRAGSAAIDLAYVAAGRCDGFFEIGLSPWDVAAGGLLVEEAGGIVTDFTGGTTHIETGNIVAAHKEIHGFLLDEIRNSKLLRKI
ncbi:MAG: inositol monophosphatase [Nitrospirae bacterium]|nr:inositol monophosphatase [Nitrospirota bacterium]